MSSGYKHEGQGRMIVGNIPHAAHTVADDVQLRELTLPTHRQGGGGGRTALLRHGVLQEALGPQR